jgi:uncharacterized protein YndB with AHSA1/START domain
MYSEPGLGANYRRRLACASAAGNPSGGRPGPDAGGSASIEIARPPEDVFSYVTDPSRLAEWQESVLSTRTEESGRPAVGSRVTQTRRIGRGERTMTSEITEISPPTSWAVRGVDGPVRGMVKGAIEPLDDRERSRVTIELDFEGHGIGMLLVPLVVRRQARQHVCPPSFDAVPTWEDDATGFASAMSGLRSSES